MQGKSLNGYPFRVEANVNARVIGPNRKVKQNIEKHNMATANLTEGVVKFLRGEFTESYISGLIPNIGNDFNIADQYIPAYMGMGCTGVGKNDDGELVVTYGSHMSPSYADTKLLQEIVPLANPTRAIVSKSVRSNTLLSQASTLMISTAYHFEDPAESQTFSIEPGFSVTSNDQLYISNNVFPGESQKQRIKSIQPITAGWSAEISTPASEADGYMDLIRLSYTDTDKSRTEVLELNCNTGIFTALTDYTFTTGLEISYDPVNFDFKFVDSVETVPFMQDGMTRTYYITELGLFSGNLSNENSKLMARVVLDEETPLIIDEGDYVVITWQIGVYALEDALYEEDISGAVVETDTYKYVVQDEPTTMAWSEVVIDEDGNEINNPAAAETRALYDVVSMDYINNDASDILRLTLNTVSGLSTGQEVSFTLPNGKDVFGTIKAIFGEQNKPNMSWAGNSEGYYLPEGEYRVVDLKKTLDENNNYSESTLTVELNIQTSIDDSIEKCKSKIKLTLQSELHYNNLYDSIMNPYLNLATLEVDENVRANNRFIYVNNENVYLLDNKPIDYPMSIEIEIANGSYGSNALQCLTSTQTLDLQIKGSYTYQNLNNTDAYNLFSSYTNTKIEDITAYNEIEGLDKKAPISGELYWERAIVNGSLNFTELNFKYLFGLDRPDTSNNDNTIYYELPDVSSCIQSIDLQPLHITYVVRPVSPVCNVGYNGVSTPLIECDQSIYKVLVALDTDRNATDLNGKSTINNLRVVSSMIQKCDENQKVISSPNTIEFTHTYKGLEAAETLIKAHFNSYKQASWDQVGDKNNFMNAVKAVLDGASIIASNGIISSTGALEGISANFNKKDGNDYFSATINNGTVYELEAEIVLSYNKDIHGSDETRSFKITYSVEG